MQCGVACLQMICRYYKKIYSTDTLHQYCFATNEGVSLLGISEAAKKLGLRTVCGRITVNQLNASSLPCILHWNQNHFVVLYKIRRGKTFYIADPDKGKIRYTKEEFKSHWISTTSQGGGKRGSHVPGTYPGIWQAERGRGGRHTLVPLPSWLPEAIPPVLRADCLGAAGWEPAAAHPAFPYASDR